jgi:hypothetical protein
MGPGQYRDKLAKVMALIGIIAAIKLHVGRKIGVLIPQFDGVATDETMTLGNWAHKDGLVYHAHYDAKIPFSAMRSCAGCGKDIGRYYLPQAKIMPPVELQEMVWPNIEAAKKQLFEFPGQEKMYTAHRFVHAMDYLRVVVLQDAAYFMSQCPDQPERANHAIYQTPLFKTKEFLEYLDLFKKEYAVSTLPENNPTLRDINIVAPKIGNQLKQVHVQSNRVVEKLEEVSVVVKAIAATDEHRHQQQFQQFQILQRNQVNMLSLQEKMYREVNFLAEFVRNGASATLGGLGAPTAENHLHPTAPINYLEEEINRLGHGINRLNPADSVTAGCQFNSAETETNATMNNVASPTEAEAEPSGPAPPSSDAYQSVLEMYMAWKDTYEPLFDDREWRREFCRKNSSELKRMQRMKYICTYVDGFVNNYSGPPSDSLSMVIAALLMEAFDNNPPEYFSWTAYEKALKAHAKRGT